jgi:hypothetical protein
MPRVGEQNALAPPNASTPTSTTSGLRKHGLHTCARTHQLRLQLQRRLSGTDRGDTRDPTQRGRSTTHAMHECARRLHHAQRTASGSGTPNHASTRGREVPPAHGTSRELLGDKLHPCANAHHLRVHLRLHLRLAGTTTKGARNMHRNQAKSMATQM